MMFEERRRIFSALLKHHLRKNGQKADEVWRIARCHEHHGSPVWYLPSLPCGALELPCMATVKTARLTGF